LKLLGEVEEYRLIFQTFLGLLPVFGRLFGIVLITFYIFSIVGQVLFGGEIFHEKSELISDTGLPSHYIYNNFNDFPSGLVTLFELMVVNNWWVIAETFIDVTNKWYRIFFMLFYFIAVLIVLNLLVAFVLDMFTS
jgi:two pore calcium channel protein